MLLLSIFIIFIILTVCILVLMAPFSLEINTRERKYILSLAWFFQIQYVCPQSTGCLRFSLFGCSWLRELKWPALDRKRLEQLGGQVLKKREDFSKVLVKMKDSWCDLLHLSSRKVEINLCTPDFLANALLSLAFAWAFDAHRFRGIQISVNYREENWLVGYFITRLWAVAWVFLKFAISRPVSRLGFSALRSRFG